MKDAEPSYEIEHVTEIVSGFETFSPGDIIGVAVPNDRTKHPFDRAPGHVYTSAEPSGGQKDKRLLKSLSPSCPIIRLAQLGHPHHLWLSCSLLVLPIALRQQLLAAGFEGGH